MNPKLTTVLRTLLGLFMVIIGFNKFFMFIEIPSPPGPGGELMAIYIFSGFLKFIGVLEVVGGVLLMLNKLVPFSLILISAIMFNATIFHVIHDPSGVGPASFCFLLSVTLFLSNKKRFSSLF